MGVFSQLLVNGIIAGSIYALVASGFSLIYSTNRFVHFAHGAVVVVAAYIMYSLFSLLNIPFFIAFLLTVLLSGFLGYIQFQFVYLPLKNKKSSTTILLMASVALMLLFENIVLLLFGSDVKLINTFEVEKGLEFFGFTITKIQILIIAVTLVLLVGLRLLLKKTRLGKSFRAVADNPSLADIMGINAKKLQSLSFVMGSAIAGVASVLIAIEQNIEPFMGSRLMIKGFTAAIIGGVSSVEGAVLGSLLLGLVENFGIWFLPSGYKDAIAFAVLILFLVFKPSGILGIHKGHRA
jgi:branched-subunit amino acid ABC-type transport system permease component